MSKEVEISQKAGDNSEQFSSAGSMHIHKPELHLHNTNVRDKYSEYLQLVEELEKEVMQGNTSLIGFIEKIQHYTSNIDTEVIGLQQKLLRAGYEKQYARVNHLKERYTKLYSENELSLATQKIHAHILAKIWTLFLTYVNPAIDEGYSKPQIAVIMNDQVIKPVEEIIAQKNVLNLDSSDIIGMIYFLTGNCHINWD
ncbi:ABC-three component system protein [uncultured Aquimarina sp.]|uniref:ABC-three component system protein n=1 Tax=uncultured Aquimarina sp. TaxID=575652 RepID=UPI002603B6EE|nr:ABC-three component system protein [uncultured Aquimarina sp.]